MTGRAYAWIVSSIVWVALVVIHGVESELTTWGIVASGVAGVFGVVALFALFAMEGWLTWARLAAPIAVAALILMTALNVFGNVYNHALTNEQFQADQAAAQLYSTNEFTLFPVEAGAVYTQPGCVPSTDTLPAGVSLWNGEMQSDGTVENARGICQLTIDISNTWVRIVPTQNGANALGWLTYPDDRKISTLTVEFPVDVRVDVFLYNPEKAKTQNVHTMPTWASDQGFCNCSTANATYSTN